MIKIVRDASLGEPPIVYLKSRERSIARSPPSRGLGGSSWRWDVDDVVTTGLHWLLAHLGGVGAWQRSTQYLAVLRRALAELALGHNRSGQVGQWSTTLWSHTARDAEPWVGRGRLAPDFGVTRAVLAEGEEEKEEEVDEEEDRVEDGEGFDGVELSIERVGGDYSGWVSC